MMMLTTHRIGRRDLLKGAGVLGASGLTAPLFSAARVLAGVGSGIPIKHVVVDMQENRSFDHYYGFAPFVGAFGVPSGYLQPDGSFIEEPILLPTGSAVCDVGLCLAFERGGRTRREVRRRVDRLLVETELEMHVRAG